MPALDEWSSSVVTAVGVVVLTAWWRSWGSRARYAARSHREADLTALVRSLEARVASLEEARHASVAVPSWSPRRAAPRRAPDARSLASSHVYGGALLEEEESSTEGASSAAPSSSRPSSRSSGASSASSESGYLPFDMDARDSATAAWEAQSEARDSEASGRTARVASADPLQMILRRLDMLERRGGRVAPSRALLRRARATARADAAAVAACARPPRRRRRRHAHPELTPPLPSDADATAESIRRTARAAPRGALRTSGGPQLARIDEGEAAAAPSSDDAVSPATARLALAWARAARAHLSDREPRGRRRAAEHRYDERRRPGARS